MRILYYTCVLFIGTIFINTLQAQTVIPNAGFETWTGSGASIEPTNWNSNKTGGGYANLGPQTCFQESTNPHGGTYCARIKTTSYIGTIVNGTCTTGKVEAPTTSKSDGYIRTIPGDANFSTAFTGRPDSIVGWYRYTSASGDQARVQVQLHVNNGSIPESGSYQGNNTANVVGRGIFTSPASNISAWTRFSAPIVYVDGRTPQYLLIVCTSSADALGGASGSELFVDDLQFIYNPSVTLGTVATGPFYISSSQGASISVPFTLVNSFNGGNTVTAQLSDANGSFSNPTTIGSVSATTSGTINATIPANTPTGSGYRIRVVTSSPALTSANNGSNIQIYLVNNNISPATTQNLPINTAGNPLTLNENPAATSRAWRFSTTSGGPYNAFTPAQTGTTYTPQFATPGTYYVVGISSYPGSIQARSNEVQINVVGNSIAPTAVQNILAGVAGNTLTVTETPAGTAREWKYATTSGGPYQSFSPAQTGNTFAPLFATAGTYYVVAVSTINGITSTSNEVRVNVTSAGLATGTINGSPFQFSPSAPDATISVPYTLSGTLNAGNVFTAELSDANGSFANPTVIGSRTATTSGTISATIPHTTPAGTGYRIRVTASNPSIIGTDNGSNLTIDQFNNAINPSTSQSIATNTTGNTLTVTESQTASRQWLFATVSGGPYTPFIPAQSGTTLLPMFSTRGMYYVVAASVNTYGDTAISNEIIFDVFGNSVSPATPQSLFTGVAGTQLTVTETPAGTSREWLYATTSGGPYQSFSPAETGQTFIPLFSNAGTYYVVAQSVINGTTVTSNEVVINVGSAIINTGSITGSPFEVSPNSNTAVAVLFTVLGTINPGNTFTAQLSDANGSFSTPTAIGTLAGTTDGTINAILPGNTPTGSGYRIRVVANDPVTIGTDNGIDLSIDLFSNSITPNITQTIAPGANGNQLTVTSSQTATQEWQYATVSGGPYQSFSPAQTGTGFSPSFAMAGTYYVVAVSTNQFNDAVTSNEVMIVVAANSIGPTTTQNIQAGANGTMLTVTETPSGTAREWLYATSSGGPYQSFSPAETGLTFTPNFAAAGTYYVVAQSTIGGITVTSNEVIINVTNSTIATGTVTGSPFEVSPNANVQISVPYTVTGNFLAGNVFTAQLSDAIGSFANPVDIGSISSTTNGTITATLPGNTPTGNGYRVRVVSSSPVVNGSDNGSNLVIDQFSNNISPSGTQLLTANTPGTTLTVSNSQNATQEWLYSTTSGGPYQSFSPAQTGNTYTPQFAVAGTYYVVAVSTNQYNDEVSSNEVTLTVQSTQLLSTTAISGAPFLISPKAYVQTTISFTSTFGATANTIYTAQLSDANGTFSNAVNLGSDTGLINSMIVRIPNNTPNGSGYRIRVIANNPSVIGTDNGSDLEIIQFANSITPDTAQTIVISQPGTSITVNETHPAYQEWMYATTAGGPYRSFNPREVAPGYLPYFVTTGTRYVVARSVNTWNDTVTSNEVRIDVDTVTVGIEAPTTTAAKAWWNEETFTIDISGLDLKNPTLLIYNTAGAIVATKQLTTTGQHSMTLNIADGLYLYRLSDGNRIITGKSMK